MVMIESLRPQVFEPMPITVDVLPKHLEDRQVMSFLEETICPRDPELYKHLLQVGYYTYIMGAMAGLRKTELRQEYNGALLHDVGKLMSPLIMKIVDTPGKLNDDERMIVKYHPVLGDELVRSKKWEGYAPYVRSHHETYSPELFGYPDGISGDSLALGAQRVSIADWYSASRASRPDQLAKSKEQSIVSVQYQFAIERWNPVLIPEFRAFIMYSERVHDTAVYF